MKTTFYAVQATSPLQSASRAGHTQNTGASVQEPSSPRPFAGLEAYSHARLRFGQGQAVQLQQPLGDYPALPPGATPTDDGINPEAPPLQPSAVEASAPQPTPTPITATP